MQRRGGSRARWCDGSRVATAAFAAQFVLFDLATRGPRAYVHLAHPWSGASAVAGATGSVLLWWLAVTTARGRTGRALLAVVAAATLTLQAVVFRYYHAPLDAQIVASARHAWADIRPVVREAAIPVASLTAIVAAIEYAVAYVAWAGTLMPAGAFSRRARIATLAIACVLAAIGHMQGPPDVRLAGSLRSLVTKEASGAMVGAVALPTLVSSRREPPSVLFVLTESVRAKDFADPTADPEVRALVPSRIDFAEMRAVASYTAVAVSAILTGRTQEGPREALLAAPDLFDAVRAVRAEREGRADGVDPASRDRAGRDHTTVAYWSAQTASLFERKDPRAAVDSFATVEDLVGHAVDDEDTVVDRGVDRLLAARATRDLPRLAAPYLLVLHFAGTHAPYFFDEARAPFTPWRREVAWSKMDELRNAYKNAIAEQDRSVAACVRAFIDAQRGHPYVIVFTSDHGEAFGEHGAIHHGQGLYDEQLHVPAWLAWGNGAFDADEAAHLRANAALSATHLDLLPTILDAFGVLDSAAFTPYRGGLRGRSLLRAPAPFGDPVPITNCTGMFPCPVNTWGMLGATHMVIAQPWDTDYRCVSLHAPLDDPDHPFTEGPPCPALRDAARRTYRTLPNGAPP